MSDYPMITALAELATSKCQHTLAAGQLRTSPNHPEIWLAIEILSVVDRNDVDRAWRRAGLIRRATPLVLPVATGDRVTPGTETAVHDQNVVLMRNGQT